jgi:predicted dehydrogenase
MMNLNPTERELGRGNFATALDQLHSGRLGEKPGRRGMTRRDFLLTAAAVPAAAGAVYFGYAKLNGAPVKAGLIGSGDEGLILLTDSNPDYVKFIAYSDIRPSSRKRALEENTAARVGFTAKYGRIDAEEIAKRSENYHEDYRRLLEDKDIELVVIALPLHLHAQAAIEALEAGKHVLCEKLMARYVTDRWQTKDGLSDNNGSGEQIPGCKRMILRQREINEERKKEGKPPLHLAIGHQRHYSILYDSAVEVLNQNLLGRIQHIRALWHRNNRPGRDSWDRWTHASQKQALEMDKSIPVELLARHGYVDLKDAQGKVIRPALKELVNWRVYQRTGGGLMAELGSHQLDACSIFLGKERPLFVSGVGGKYYYQDDREVEDHVYCTFEFPGKKYDAKKDARENDIVVVTYSSINTNGFEGYGECIQGTDGTLIVDSEKEVLLYKERGVGKEKDGPPRSTYVKVVEAGGAAGGGPQLDSSGSVGGASGAVQRVLGQASASRGYREEMEHLAYCIRNPSSENKPRCPGEVALADAVMALTANLAMERQTRIQFREEWFNPEEIGKTGDPWTDPRVQGNKS